MKGIGIIAVVVGHCATPDILHDFIFAWHMPLFFLVSGYFFRAKPVKEYLARNVRGLLLPYALTAFVMFLLTMTLWFMGKPESPLNSLMAIFVGAGSQRVPMMGQYFVGAIWFLLAIFWCRILYNSITDTLSNKYIVGGVILALFLLTVYVSRWLYIPSNLLQGVNAMLFFHIGHIAGVYGVEKQPYRKWTAAATAVLLAVALYASPTGDVPMSMVRCHYACWPLNVATAVLCTYTIYYCSALIASVPLLKRVLAYFGSISLLILCVHIVDLNYGHYAMNLFNGMFFHFDHWQKVLYDNVWHLVAALAGAWLLAQTKLVRLIFRIG